MNDAKAEKAEKAKFLLACLLMIYSSYLLLMQASMIFDFNLFHEEHRVLYTQHSVENAQLFEEDYIYDYLISKPHPIFYSLLLRTWFYLGLGSLISFHRVLVILCYLAFLVGMGVAALNFFKKGKLALSMVLSLAISQPSILYQISSATPHSFAFPCLAWCLVFLSHGSYAALSFLTILTSSLYFPAAAIIGLAFAIFVILDLKRRSSNRLAPYLILILFTGILSISLSYPNLRGRSGFGEALVPFANPVDFPESGSDGRIFMGVEDPFGYVVRRFFGQSRDFAPSLSVVAFALFATAVSLSIYGFWNCIRDESLSLSLLSFGSASLFCLLLVLLYRVDLSYRFLLYPFMTVFPLLLTGGILSIDESMSNRGSSRRALASYLIFLFFIVSMDSLNEAKIGFMLSTPPQIRELESFASQIGRNTLVAAWPKSMANEFFPYLYKRPVLLLHKAHYPSHEKYVIEMRSRMVDLINAYLATTIEPLVKLKTKWRVRYLIVDKEHFTENEAQLSYFAPFDDLIAKLQRKGKRIGFFLEDPPEDLLIWENERLFVLDLDRLLDKVKE